MGLLDKYEGRHVRNLEGVKSSENKSLSGTWIAVAVVAAAVGLSLPFLAPDQQEETVDSTTTHFGYTESMNLYGKIRPEQSETVRQAYYIEELSADVLVDGKIPVGTHIGFNEGGEPLFLGEDSYPGEHLGFKKNGEPYFAPQIIENAIVKNNVAMSKVSEDALRF